MENIFTFRNRRFRFWVIVATFVAGAALLVHFSGVLLLFTFAFLIAYVMDPVVLLANRRWNLPRWSVVLILYGIVLIGLTLFFVFAVPAMARTVKKSIKEEWPEVRQQVEDFLKPEASARTEIGGKAPAHRKTPATGTEEEDDVFAESMKFIKGKVREYVKSFSDEAGAWLQHGVKELGGVVKKVVKFVFNAILVLMVAAFLTNDKERVWQGILSLIPASYRPGFEELVRELDKGLSGVIRGQVTICLANGVLTGIGLFLFAIPFALVLTLLATVLMLIPVFGSILSTVPICLIALATKGTGSALLVLAWIIVIHMLEAYYLNPKIIGSHAEIHPVVIIFALVAGEHSYGMVGALLAVPIASVLQALLLAVHRKLTQAEDEEEEPGAPPAPPQAPSPAGSESAPTAPAMKTSSGILERAVGGKSRRKKKKKTGNKG